MDEARHGRFGTAGRDPSRLLLLLAVLAGLFLMHGMSAAAPGGCHGGGAAMSTTTRGSVVHESMAHESMVHEWMVLDPAAHDPAAHHSMTHPVVDAPAGPGDRHLTAAAMVGEACVPLRPDEFAGVVVLALSLVALIPRPPADRHAPPSVKALRRFPHGPPRGGARLLTDLGVCRT